jgi:hypothetical protein
MKKLPILLLLVLLVGAGCSSTRPGSRWPNPDRRDYPRREDTRRNDPVVGRTTDGRRIYEDRRSGRIYTVDRAGRPVYQDRTILQRQRSSRSTTYGGKNHGTYQGNGRKNGHYKRDRDDDRWEDDDRDDDDRRGRSSGRGNGNRGNGRGHDDD